MVSILDSLQTSTHYKYSKRHNNISNIDNKRSIKTLNISTPINTPSKGLKDDKSQLFNQLTNDYNMYYQVIVNYTPVKRRRENGELELSTSKKNYLKVNKGDTVQLLGYDNDKSNPKEQNMVYVKLINTLGEGLLPFEILKEHTQLNKMVRNQKSYHNRIQSAQQNMENLNLLDFNFSNSKNGESTLTGKYIISNPKSIVPSPANANYITTPPNNTTFMNLTPPTSPSTLNSSTFSMGCVSRGTVPSNLTSLTLTKNNLPRSMSSGQHNDKYLLVNSSNNSTTTTFTTPTKKYGSSRNTSGNNSFENSIDNSLENSTSSINTNKESNDILSSPINLAIEKKNKSEVVFDMEIPITNCKILSIDNAKGRLLYNINFTNQLNQKLLKVSYYQDFYSLHTQLINYNNGVTNKSPRGILPLPNLPSPTFYSDMDTNNVINERLKQFTEYLDSLVLLIYEFDNNDLKKIWFNWLSQDNDTKDGERSENLDNVNRNISQSSIDKIKIKVLHNGDYHALKTLAINIDKLSKLDILLRERLNVGEESVYYITALVDGWYKVNLSNENVYTEVFGKVKDSQRFVLEIKEF